MTNLTTLKLRASVHSESNIKKVKIDKSKVEKKFLTHVTKQKN